MDFAFPRRYFAEQFDQDIEALKRARFGDLTAQERAHAHRIQMQAWARAKEAGDDYEEIGRTLQRAGCRGATTGCGDEP